MSYELKLMARLIRSFNLSPDTEETLHLLSSGASDYIGRSISESAIVRALLRQIAGQGPSAADALFILIEQELNEGVRWGKKSP
jgi:DNA-binding NarL/FixJ family response regulator